jgi:hypothetical protein
MKESAQEASGDTYQRNFKNYALQPLLQIKLGLYCILLSLAFATAMTMIIYMNLNKFFIIVLELTGVESEVRDLLMQYFEPVKYQIGVALVVYIAATLIVSLTYTHKLVGPTIAFRRHLFMLRQNKYDHRTTLRENDAFQEVADELNNLSSHLQKNSADKLG